MTPITQIRCRYDADGAGDAALRQLPYITAFDWAWRDFYPNSRFWGEPP